MQQKIVNIARNTSYYTIALILQKVISFSYFVIIARALGPEDLGKYYLAISFTSIFAVFIDLGLSNVLTRETAKRQYDASTLLGNILAIKIPLSIISVFAVALIANLLGYSQIVKLLIYISSISMLLDSFTLTFFAVSRGFHNLSYESVASVLFQVVVLISGLVTLEFGWGIAWLMSALSAASIINFIYSAVVLKKKWGISLRPHFDRQLAKTIFRIALPFAIFGIFQRFYMFFDSVLLSKLAGDRAVGVYQISFKIIFALQFLPAAFGASLYPAFSTYWVNNRKQLGITFERAMNYLLIISLPITIGVYAIADKVIILFKSGYADAVLPLKISMFSLTFIFLNFAVGALLNACDRQRFNTANMGIATVASIALNLFLIPSYQAVGATITVVATNLLMLVVGLSIVPSITAYDWRKVVLMLAKVLAASMVMGFFAQNLKNSLNIFLVVFIAGGIYLACLFILRAFTKEDVASILASFKKSNPSKV